MIYNTPYTYIHTYIHACRNSSGFAVGGQWNDKGCKIVESDSNSSMSVCECNHLTHFGILLNPRSPNVTISIGAAIITNLHDLFL